MHAAVVQAKAAGIAAVRRGHRRASARGDHGGHPAPWLLDRTPGPADAPDSYCAMVHGTGHGVGLEVHEPPLLDKRGPQLIVGDAVTIEPGLVHQGHWWRACGGHGRRHRCDGSDNLNRLPEGLDWR